MFKIASVVKKNLNKNLKLNKFGFCNRAIHDSAEMHFFLDMIK